MIPLVLFPLASKPSMNVYLDFFYLHGGHIELLRFKEYYGMPRGASVFTRAFRASFSLSFPRKRL